MSVAKLPVSDSANLPTNPPIVNCSSGFAFVLKSSEYRRRWRTGRYWLLVFKKILVSPWRRISGCPNDRTIMGFIKNLKSARGIQSDRMKSAFLGGQTMTIKKIRSLIVLITCVIQSNIAIAGNLPNGAQCARLPSTARGKDVDAGRSLCQSNYCMPGPSERRFVTEWYCIAKDMNCAWPGTAGEKYGHNRYYGDRNMVCSNPKDGGWAQFLPK